MSDDVKVRAQWSGLLSVKSDELPELRAMAEALYWSAKTPNEERVAVLLMKILGAGAQENVSALPGHR